MLDPRLHSRNDVIVDKDEDIKHQFQVSYPTPMLKFQLVKVLVDFLTQISRASIPHTVEEPFLIFRFKTGCIIQEAIANPLLAGCHIVLRMSIKKVSSICEIPPLIWSNAIRIVFQTRYHQNVNDIIFGASIFQLSCLLGCCNKSRMDVSGVNLTSTIGLAQLGRHIV